MDLLPYYILAFAFGAAIGSFLNVVILRLPEEDQSIVFPASHCPSCRKPIAWYDNLPLLSYLRLRGRCRFCKASIPCRYPLVELSGGLLVLVLWYKFPFNNVLIAYLPSLCRM